jgi:AI-2 transport protein TqsA
MEQKHSPLRSAAYFFIVIIGIAVIFGILKELADIFIPFIIAYFLFFVFSPLNNFLQRKKVPIWGTILIDLFIVFVIFGGISSIIIDSFSRFGEQLPEYQRKLNNIVSATAASVGINDPELKNFQITKALQKIDYRLLAGNVFTSTFSALGSLLFVLFFFIFVVTGHNNIYLAIRKRYLAKKKSLQEEQQHEQPNNTEEQENEADHQKEKSIQRTFQDITDQVQKYILTKFFISLSTAIIEGIAIWIFGVDFVIVWAVLIFLLNFIPNIGSIIGVALPCIMALVQFGSIPTALLLAAVLFVLDTIMGNVIEPKVFGDRLGLNPLVILFSLLLWGYIWGIIGALLSVPLTAIFKIIISRSDSPNLVFVNDLMSSESHE